MTKYEIRNKISGLKSLVEDLEKTRAAEAVFEQLEETAAFLLSENILMYHSLPDELDTVNFLRKWKDKKRFFLPRVNGVNLDLLPYDENTLQEGYKHIMEPSGDDAFSLEKIEMIVVPGVAFDRSGRRLGRGKGFYDRLLADTSAVKIGICYEFQLVDELPAEKHDIPMDIVITEKTTIINKI